MICCNKVHSICIATTVKQHSWQMVTAGTVLSHACTVSFMYVQVTLSVFLIILGPQIDTGTIHIGIGINNI